MENNIQDTPIQPPVSTTPVKTGFAITSMILGIVAIVLGFCFWYISIPCAIIGLVLSILSLNANKANGTKYGMATAGLVLTIIALCSSIIFTIIGIMALSALGSSADALRDALSSVTVS